MNLEEYFETKNSQDFPSEKDYVAIYRTFKQFMKRSIMKLKRLLQDWIILCI